ncbi:MAG TPA: cell surface protein [bacterium]|nr:cell surface protein [bacterium]
MTHLSIFLVLTGLTFHAYAVDALHDPTACLSPETIVAGRDGKTLYIGEKTACQVAKLDGDPATIQSRVSLPGEPTGLALSPDGHVLYVTCSSPAGTLCAVDTENMTLLDTLPSGAGACAPALSPNGKTIFVCNRFENSVSQIDLNTKTEIHRYPVSREPIASALTPDGKTLAVAHHLPAGPANAEHVAASVWLIDAQQKRTLAEIAMPNGGTCVKGLCLSPDGRFAFVTHILAHFPLPTTQLDRGWMANNALTVIDIPNARIFGTVLLDEMDRGAANPWAVACSPDGRYLGVTHAGTHELSLINWPALRPKLESPGQSHPATDLHFLKDYRIRIPLPGRGPRGLAFTGPKAVVTLYFSNNLAMVAIPPDAQPAVKSISLGETALPDTARRGESLFHDASIGFQGWQSCSTCHPDARVDGLNWDLLNDGLGNPKNTKSLLLSHQTPPAMSTGVRETAEEAVRSGMKHILFSVRTEIEYSAIDEYLKSLRPWPSPILRDSRFQEAARRGERLFHDPAVGCAKCHPGPLFTDLTSYDVGTRGPLDKTGQFDTPHLIELWRTAPYLHDGGAATLRDVLTTRNANDQHGKTSHLTPEQIRDLEAFLMSL